MSDAKRNDGEGREECKLGKALRKHLPGDPAFADKIRKLRPDWFAGPRSK